MTLREQAPEGRMDYCKRQLHGINLDLGQRRRQNLNLEFCLTEPGKEVAQPMALEDSGLFHSKHPYLLFEVRGRGY